MAVPALQIAWEHSTHNTLGQQAVTPVLFSVESFLCYVVQSPHALSVSRHRLVDRSDGSHPWEYEPWFIHVDLVADLEPFFGLRVLVSRFGVITTLQRPS